MEKVHLLVAVNIECEHVVLELHGEYDYHILEAQHQLVLDHVDVDLHVNREI